MNYCTKAPKIKFDLRNLFIWLFGWLVVVEFMNSVEKQTIRRLTRHNDSDIKTIIVGRVPKNE